MQKKDLIIVSAVTLVDHDGRVLISKRPEGKYMSGFWEFPGGKLEIGETPEECLIREIKEEIDINLSNFCFSPLTFSLNEYDEFNILLLLYVCREWEGIILGKEKQELKWVFPKDLYNKNLLPTNKELIPFVRDNISSN